MKKYFLMAIMAATTLSFMSCDKKDKEETGGGSEDPTVTPIVVLSDDELDLPKGYKYQLSATVSPAKDVAITWTSSNEKIAYVDEDGYVYGIDYGTANIIASAEGYKADTCVVTVYDAQWDACQLWGFDGFDEQGQGDWVRLSNDTCEVKINVGGQTMTVHCFTASATYMLCGGGVECVETATGAYITGEGDVAFLEKVPTWIITEDLGKGPDYYYVSTNLEIVDPAKYDPTKAENACTTPAGQLVSLEQHAAWYEDETGETAPGISGATVYYADLENNRWYPFNGILGTGIYGESDGELYYKSNVYWSDGIYGLAVNADYSFVQPYQWANFKAYYYEKLMTAASAPARAPKAGARIASAQELKNIHTTRNIQVNKRDIKGFRPNHAF
ncbi:MAG: Ig-like domain-containing protein [Paludibacteraceae bacterium]|nr:Ig-like domain-containing protein [Paludibacteraceae bacterium]